MPRPALAPLAEMPMPPHIVALPKADIHIHQEWSPRLDQVLAQREGRATHAGYHPHLLDLVARRGVTVVPCPLILDVNFISSLPVKLGSAYKAWVNSKLVQMVWGED